MNQVEYLIIEFAVEFYPSLMHVAHEYNISYSEIVNAAHSLFQNGDILASLHYGEDLEENEEIYNTVLTRSEIEAHLNGEFPVNYYLTPQGGAKWEALANPNWNQFFTTAFFDCPANKSGIIGGQRQILEKLLAMDCFMHEKHIPGTEVWDILEPWKATYWKTLTKGYLVCYQKKSNYWYLDDEHTPITWAESYEQAGRWYAKMTKWYTRPRFY
ncbi:hypothetical protein NIES4071_02170 [Calothrix sp. NIES-4071]|nr:hypothetical protein NIES4071_02170 [Calothrix sp. NIES-4071]BAZ54563.1 hypothetical protein NIES4105_02160 [Calothrix sp. NIES-4105]